MLWIQDPSLYVYVGSPMRDVTLFLLGLVVIAAGGQWALHHPRKVDALLYALYAACIVPVSWVVRRVWPARGRG